MSEKKFLTGSQILAIPDIKTEELYIPEWDTWVLVRTLTGAEYAQYLKSIQTGKGKNKDVDMANAQAKLVALATVDQSGRRLWTASQVTALGEKSSAALARIFDKATDMAGLGEDEITDLVDELHDDPLEGSASA